MLPVFALCCQGRLLGTSPLGLLHKLVASVSSVNTPRGFGRRPQLRWASVVGFVLVGFSVSGSSGSSGLAVGFCFRGWVPRSALGLVFRLLVRLVLFHFACSAAMHSASLLGHFLLAAPDPTDRNASE